ncbi:MAG: sigma 54-interacting transcriptional regulator [Gammaproteobacteria bacterium]|nr:sigma 54-interacting transcriptional regulator [Gammaproteobacteria bacterium]MBU1646411.1 sigma 54-interacting transcriptional regulator [Gammaproteobacteria bacterium]MBU1970954.1 sigma 54-interacting transcriptional regulator [Gammaproteobacteria bacterium]
MTAQGIEQLAAYLEGEAEPSIVLDDDYRILAANAAYRRDFGGSQDVTGRRCYEVSHHIDTPCDQAGESCPLRLTAQSGRPQRVLHLHHTPRGEEHVDVETRPLAIGPGKPRAGQARLYVESMRVVRHASSQPAVQGLVGRSPAFQAMLARITRAAPAEATVLLLGQTGTGKELAARAVHEGSPRADGPFVTVDCSGLTETLFESELFGYEKGAFTGATHLKTGLVEAAGGGTLFLDEIGELPPSQQAKLLRLLETGTYRRVGGVEWLPSDFRLVSATHRDLAAMVRADEFRRDLYYRINTFPIHMPALAERREDIPLLAKSLLARIDADNRRHHHLAASTLRELQARDYEGNIRELRNLIERATLLADGQEVLPQHLDDGTSEFSAAKAQPKDGMFRIATPVKLDELESRYLTWALATFAGSRGQVASELGISERTLYRLLRKRC